MPVFKLQTLSRVCLLLMALLPLFSCRESEALKTGQQEQAPASKPAVQTPPAEANRRQVYFGDLHLHTAMSFDAAASSTRTTPDQAYRFARGEPVDYFGRQVQRQTPLDFLAVTDHAEYLGVAEQARLGEAGFAGSDWPARLQAVAGDMVGFLRIFSPGGFRGEPAIPEFVDESLIRSNWQRQVDAAERHYRPGEFTTFVAYEWSPMPGGAHLHRNVIFRGPDYPQRPFTAIDSMLPEELWRYAENNIAEGRDMLLIPHNSNLSEGLMFAPQDSYGEAIDRAYAERRSRLERLAEISQNKGTSETRPELSPTDEQAGFELVSFGQDAAADLRGGYLRTALMRGLEISAASGANPFDFGFVGSSDFHSGLSSSEEYNFPGGLGSSDEQGDPRKVLSSVNPLMGSPTTILSASGLTGVWAEANTREALFDALQRREVFATSGGRMSLRMFAGWQYADDLPAQDNWRELAYRDGVAMGSVLPPISGEQAPALLLQAVKDPDGGNIDRIQVVKLWLEDGVARQKVFDALWADARQPDAAGRLPALPADVDLATATYGNRYGSPEVLGIWRDPEFNAAQPAVYYARALAVETPRWSSYLAVNNGLPLPEDVPATIQERAWGSPVFYRP